MSKTAKIKKLKIRSNVPLAPEEKYLRRHWDFGSMKIGDVIDVEDHIQWPLASKRAHAYASRRKWKITAIWSPTLNLGRIRRLS